MGIKLRQYLILMRFDKPIGILLLLWPTLWGIWIAGNGKPNGWILTVFVVGVIIMRAAGCTINDFADRHFDGYVERTQNRPLATGSISAKEALILFAFLLLSAFALVLTLNLLTILLSFIAVALAASYPFMKRITYWPQLVLGLAFAFGIPMAFAAETEHIPRIAWLLMICATLWTVIYDTQYAMADREEDVLIGLKSTAILFGRFDIAAIVFLQALVLTLFILIGWLQSFNICYFAGVSIAMLLMLYQQILIRKRNPEKCLRAFLNNNWLGLTIFLGIVLNYLFKL